MLPPLAASWFGALLATRTAPMITARPQRARACRHDYDDREPRDTHLAEAKAEPKGPHAPAFPQSFP
jgi:hypothetical protein